MIEEDLNPDVDKPGRRKKLDARGGSQEKELPEVDWDKESVPLLPTGGEYSIYILCLSVWVSVCLLICLFVSN